MEYLPAYLLYIHGKKRDNKISSYIPLKIQHQVTSLGIDRQGRAKAIGPISKYWKSIGKYLSQKVIIVGG